MEHNNSQGPLPRLPTVVTSRVAGFLPYCVPSKPSNVAADASTSAQPAASAGLLHAVCGALLAADTSYLQPRLQVQQLAPKQGTLEHALLELNPLVFRNERGTQHSVSTPGAPQAHPQKAQQQDKHRAAGRGSAASARPAPAAADAAAGASEVQHAAKRRKTVTPTSEEYVARTVDVQQVAASVAEDISSFMQRAAAQDDTAQQADEAPAGKRARKSAGHGGRSAQWGPVSIDMLKQLQSSLAAGKQAGILSQLDQEQLRQLLLLLLELVRMGQDQLLDEQDMAGSESTQAVNTALEAACCCMQVLSAASMHNSLYIDELMTAVVSLAKYHLQYNVLALHDPQYKRLYRPAAAAAQDAVPTSTGKRKLREAAARPPKALADVKAKLELLLSLLAQVVERIVLEVELLLPLVRVALTCLSVDSLQLVQVQAVALAVSVFKAYPQQRTAMADEVLSTVVGKIHVSGKAPARLFEATGPALQPLPVMMATALLVQLVQVSVDLPEMEADPASIQVGFKAAYGWSEYLWKGIFSSLPAAKAAKSDGTTDFKLVMQALVADLLTVQMLPEWPAANVMLRRFIKVLVEGENGLKHKDAAVKLACVEFMGQLATQLCLDALATDREADEVQAMKEAAQALADPGSVQGQDDELHRLPDLLLLNYLAANSGGSDSGSSVLASARRFVCCRMLHDALHKTPGAAVEDKDVTLLLVQHRQLQDNRQAAAGACGSSGPLSRSDVVALQRQGVMHGPLGAARVALIKWLLEAGSRQGTDPSPATVRTKVFKCLGSIVEADSRVMALPEVAAAVRLAQEDDSAAVKEAVLELLVKLIGTNPELAGEYFDALVNASYDQGIMVRKRAIRALWECCSCPGFSRADDAIVTVLQRANDREDSMKSLVTKICGEMWFTAASNFAGLDGEAAVKSSSAATRTPAVRAAELAAVSLRLYEAGGRAIHVPLAPDNGLIVILKEVLGTASSSSVATPSAKEQKELAQLREGAADVAQALLEMILQQHQQENGDESGGADSTNQGSFQYLLALHALTAADPSLAVPSADTQRYVRLLAPYASNLGGIGAPAQGGRMSAAGAGGGSVDDVSRRAAEEGVCLLAVLDAALDHLGCVEQIQGDDLAASLSGMLNKQRYTQVITAGCQLLCTLARMHATAAAHVTHLADRLYKIAATLLSSEQQAAGTPEPAHLHHAPRLLFMLGQLCRNGANILDIEAANKPSSKNCIECLELCVSLWHRQGGAGADAWSRLREGALTAIGLIIIGRPQLMLQRLQLSTLESQQHSGGLAHTAHSGGSGDAGSPDVGQDSRAGQLSGQGSGVMQGLLSGANVVSVYTSVLADEDVAMSVKTRVLTNLVELLRAEEAAVIARQKEAEAAGAAARLPSTTHRRDAKAPLARVNGENDAAGVSGSGSVIQCVWDNVLSLATGVGGHSRHAGGSGGGLPPATPPMSKAGVLEAAATRRKALELIEVVLRGGLVAPWMAVPPLVAQLTDELPDTRATALKVLKSASEKFPDFVASNLAPGVLEAFNFQSRLWAAKHSGQPLPKGPSGEVLEGLSAMYSEIVQATQGSRQRFLTALLKPFDAACNLAASQSAAAREDPSRLAFCAYVAANLPFKKGDEPLVLLHVINSYISRLAQEVRDVLRRALLRLGLRDSMGLEDEDEDEGALLPPSGASATPSQQQQQDAAAAGASEQQAVGAQHATPHGNRNGHPHHHHGPVALPLALPLPQWLAAPLKASMGLSMLLVLKQYLMAAYYLSDERVAQYELKGEKARAEAKAIVSKSKRTGDFGLAVVNLLAVQDGTGELLAAQYKTFAGLLDSDTANYKEMAVLAALADDAELEGPEAAAPATHGGKLAGATPAAAAGLVVYSMEAKTRSTKGRAPKATTGGRGSTAGRGSRGRGTGRGASTGRGSKKAKPRRRKYAADDSSEEEADSGDEDWGSARAAPKARLFD